MPSSTTKQSQIQARRKTPRRVFLFVDDRQRKKFYADFGKRVHELRLQKGLTQEVLAKIAGVDRSYLSQIEAGKRRLALHVAVNLANALQFSIDESIRYELNYDQRDHRIF